MYCLRDTILETIILNGTPCILYDCRLTERIVEASLSFSSWQEEMIPRPLDSLYFLASFLVHQYRPPCHRGFRLPEENLYCGQEKELKCAATVIKDKAMDGTTYHIYGWPSLHSRWIVNFTNVLLCVFYDAVSYFVIKKDPTTVKL